MTKFIVKGFVKYNGQQYTSGSVVEVQKKDVEEFKKFGWQVVGEKPTKDSGEAGNGNQKGEGEGKKEGEGQGSGEAGQGEGKEEGKKEPEVVELTEEQIEALLKEKPELVGLTNAQLEALLEEKGVEFVKGSKKAILLAYLA